MGETPTRLEWLLNQEAEWKWAIKYLKESEKKDFWEKFQRKLPRGISRYEGVVAGIHAIQQQQGGGGFISRMRNALRQRKYRSTSNGRKPYTFVLPTELGRQLEQLAEGARWRKGEVVEDMMSGHARLQAEHQRRIDQFTQLREADLVNAKMIIRTWEARYEAALKQIEQLANEVARLTLRQESSPHHDEELEDALTSKAAKKILKKAKRAIEEETKLLAFSSGIAPATFDRSEPLDGLPISEEQEQEQEQPKYGPEYGPEDPENNKAP